MMTKIGSDIYQRHFPYRGFSICNKGQEEKKLAVQDKFKDFFFTAKVR